MNRLNLMLAHLLQAVLLIELGLYSLGIGFLWQHEGVKPWLAILVALGIAIGWRGFVVGLMFYYAWLYRAVRPPEMCIDWRRAAGLFLTEFAALVVLYTFLQPLGNGLRPRRPVPETSAFHLPVLLIHGYFCNRGYWWAMERYLRSRGIGNLFTINLEPVFGNIDDYAAQVAERVEQICALTDVQRVILVGHSMGGLVARAYVQRFGGELRVVKIITLGAPHHGTEHLKLALINSTNVQQMRMGSPWLEYLNETQHCEETVPITSIYSYHDNLVAPQDSSILHGKGVKNIPCAGLGHLAMVFSKTLQALVYQEIMEVNSN